MALESLRRSAAAELRRLIAEEAADFAAIDSVWSALATRGKLLSEGTGFCWGLLPLLVCEAAGGDPSIALPLAAATDCFISAADVLDDVQDADAPDALWCTCGVPTAANVAFLLLSLSQLSIHRLKVRGAQETQVAAIGEAFAAAGVRACKGQQRDLSQSTADTVDEDEYLGTIGDKSGALVAAVCRAGAILATCQHTVLEGFAEFGLNLGIALQISNDIVAISSTASERNDLRIGRRTIPLIYALEYAPEHLRREIAALLTLQRRGQLGADGIARLAELLSSSGGIDYASVVASIYWQRARSTLERITGLEATALSELVAKLHGQ